jgi:hypothetical protein
MYDIKTNVQKPVTFTTSSLMNEWMSTHRINEMVMAKLKQSGNVARIASVRTVGPERV